jgi:hypothetical protein
MTATPISLKDGEAVRIESLQFIKGTSQVFVQTKEQLSQSVQSVGSDVSTPVVPATVLRTLTTAEPYFVFSTPGDWFVTSVNNLRLTRKTQ